MILPKGCQIVKYHGKLLAFVLSNAGKPTPNYATGSILSHKSAYTVFSFMFRKRNCRLFSHNALFQRLSQTTAL